MSSVLKEQKCPICHKTFVPAPYHTYKTHNKVHYVCSYHCALASEKAFEERSALNRERRNKRRKNNNDECDMQLCRGG